MHKERRNTVDIYLATFVCLLANRESRDSKWGKNIGDLNLGFISFRFISRLKIILESSS